MERKKPPALPGETAFKLQTRIPSQARDFRSSYMCIKRTTPRKVKPGFPAVNSRKSENLPMSKRREDEPKKTVYRDSEDGQFVTKRYAEAHPRTTERERVDVGRNDGKRK